MKDSNTRRDRHWWSAQHSAWELSGQSVVAFCKERGINYQSFYKWRSKFKQEGSVKSNVSTVKRNGLKDEESPSSVSPLSSSRAPFVEVAVDSRETAPSTMTLESPGGWRIQLRSPAGLESLEKVVELLEGLS